MQNLLQIAKDRINENREVSALHFDSLSDVDKKIYLGRQNFIVDNVSLYILISICAGSYLAGLLSYAGVPASINGIVLSIPVLAGFFQIIGAVISQKIQSQKKFVVFGIAVHRICLSIVFLYPIIFGTGIVCVIMIIATYAIGFFIGTAIGPAASNWLISLVPPNGRGAYFSKRERYSLLGVAVATMVAGVILDKSEAAGLIVWGFAVIGVILLAVSIVDVVYVSRIYEPPSEHPRVRFSLANLIEPIRDKSFLKVIIIFILWQASAQILIPFLGLYLIKDIGMEYTLIGFVILLVTLEKAIIVRRWGVFADRTSWDYVLKIAVIIYAVGNILLLFMSPGNYFWIYPFSAIVSNVAWSVLGISLVNLQFQFIKPENAKMYIGMCGTISGLAGFMFALLGSQILRLVNKLDIFINGTQFLILLSTVLGFILAFYIHKTMGHKKLEIADFTEVVSIRKRQKK